MSSTRPGPSVGRADGRRNKRLVLRAAAEALAENPQVSVGEIAERAGVTRATVYRHYPLRDELVSAVAAESAAELVPQLLEEMRALAWPEALDLLAHRVISIGAQYRDVILLAAPRLEESARLAVAGEPIEAEIAARRTAGDVTSSLPDAWLALCVRTVCLAAIGRLTDPDADLDEVTRHLAGTLRALCG